jgi:uracil-DNA glycosylase family 4
MVSSLEKKEKDFNRLISKIKKCENCPRMRNREKVLSYKNGYLNSKVIFIAEAPGRLGAERTCTPLYGDKTGDNFEKLLLSINWKREDIFITNAILCNPQDINGNNATPTNIEIANCSIFLKETLEIINPDVIVTLGKKALEALKHIENHNYILKTHVAKKLSWNNKCLFPLYHPSPLAMLHRDFNKQKADFRKLMKIVKP